MTSAELLVDTFGRIRAGVSGVVGGLTPSALAFRVDGEANSIAWLIWHLTRIQDDHVADVAGAEQVWRTNGWFEAFGLPFEVAETGYGHSAAAVGATRPSGDLLTGYHEAVSEQTVAYVGRLVDRDLDRVVDESWDPPVTLGVRLVSVLADDLEHLGQAAFVRGVLQRR